MTTTRPRTIAALDVPAADVAAEAACVVLRQAARETHSESDLIAYANDQFLIAHPKACSQDADYPGWAEQIAEAEVQNRLYRQVARWNAAHPVGTPVTAYPGIRNEHGHATTTRSPAWVVGGHTAVVMVDGYAGGIALAHIDIRPGGTS